MYDQAARDAGLNVVTWFDDSPMPAAGLFHGFNVDRPLEIYPKLVEAKRRGLPFVLSTIHCPIEWLRRFRRFEPPTGLFGRLLYRSPLGHSVPVSEAIREVGILLSQRRLTRLSDLSRTWSERVRWLLNSADRVALLSQEEGSYLEQDLGYRVRSEQALVLPNWVEGVGEASATAPPLFRELAEPPVIVVGRIEPRKNSQRLCRLADRARRPVVFIGRPHPGEGRYVEAFARIVRASRDVRWIAGVPRSTMGSFYNHGSFLLTASFVEVSPLVDIEALAFGCPVATTRYALHHRFLPPDTPVCDPYDDESILERLRWRPGRVESRSPIDALRCRRLLIDTYESLLGSREGSEPV